jgi:hypothetical protein
MLLKVALNTITTSKLNGNAIQILLKVALNTITTSMSNRWFYLGTPVSSTYKSDHHNIIEILLKVVLNTIILTLTPHSCQGKLSTTNDNNVIKKKRYMLFCMPSAQ